jgi:hypothetical protein
MALSLWKSGDQKFTRVVIKKTPVLVILVSSGWRAKQVL